MSNNMTTASLFSMTPAGKSADGVRVCQRPGLGAGKLQGAQSKTPEKNDFSEVINKVINGKGAGKKAPEQIDTPASPDSVKGKKTSENSLETGPKNIQALLAFIQQMIQQGIITLQQIQQWIPENISPDQLQQLQQWLTKVISPELIQRGIEGDSAARQEIFQDLVSSLEKLSDEGPEFAGVNKSGVTVKGIKLKNVFSPEGDKRSDFPVRGPLKNAGDKTPVFRNALVKMTGDKEAPLNPGEVTPMTGGKGILAKGVSPFVLAQATDKLSGQAGREKPFQPLTHLADLGGVAPGDGLRGSSPGNTSAVLKVAENVDAGPVDITGQIVRAVNFSRQDGQYRVRLTLQPPHLGKMDVALSVKDHHVRAVFLVDNSAAHEAVTHELPQLQAHLVQQGFKVSEFSVQVGSENPQGFQPFQGNSQHSEQESDGKNRGNKVEEPDGVLALAASSQGNRLRENFIAGPERINVFI